MRFEDMEASGLELISFYSMLFTLLLLQSVKFKSEGILDMHKYIIGRFLIASFWLRNSIDVQEIKYVENLQVIYGQLLESKRIITWIAKQLLLEKSYNFFWRTAQKIFWRFYFTLETMRQVCSIKEKTFDYCESLTSILSIKYIYLWDTMWLISHFSGSL